MSNRVMKRRQIRDQSNEELRHRMSQLKKELYELRLVASTGTVEKPHQFREKKKELATLLTILKERELQNASSTRTS